MSLESALASGRVLLMDGAMGTQLARLRLDCTERANLSHAQAVREVHSAYAAAGAEVVLTCTFQSNPVALARSGLEPRLEEINRAAIGHARRAAPRSWVLGDVGPMLSPGRYEEFSDREALARVLASLEGCDGVLFETCSSPAVLAAVEFACHRVAEVEGAPLLVSL